MKDAVITEDLRRTMRSFHRLIELKKMQSPDILIQKEIELLSKRFLTLSAEELIFMMKSFSEYHDTECTDDALASETFFKNSSKYFSNIN